MPVSVYPCWSDPPTSPHNIMLYTPEERAVLAAVASIDVIGRLFGMCGYATRALIVHGAARSPGELFPLLADPGTSIHPPPALGFATRRLIRGEWEYTRGQLIPRERTHGLVRLLASGAIRPYAGTAPSVIHHATLRRFFSPETLATYAQAYETGDISMFTPGHTTPAGPLQALCAPPASCVGREGRHRILHRVPDWPPGRTGRQRQEEPGVP